MKLLGKAASLGMAVLAVVTVVEKLDEAAKKWKQRAREHRQEKARGS
jgi:heme exporter protein D